ncbi:hypothetical protein LR48_Vigan01g028100 [Vigna angularis]|uniref:Uncharacterized protein n=1 Tax=Phaseolus angularis TaxID=3914 RepID=A0A0L9TJW8_PHAAN|nr:hypothetical protein LR48_Vigan01g028100 [Vigna angularis]
MFDSSMYPFHPKLPGAAPCLCPLHHASCTGVTPRPRLRARGLPKQPQRQELPFDLIIFSFGPVLLNLPLCGGTVRTS